MNLFKSQVKRVPLVEALDVIGVNISVLLNNIRQQIEIFSDHGELASAGINDISSGAVLIVKNAEEVKSLAQDSRRSAENISLC